MKPCRSARLSVLALLTVLGGCATAPATHWLSLPLPLGGTTQVVGQAAVTQVLVVRRVGIPEYLQTDKVRYRYADSLLGEWPHTAWAERLEAGLTHHLVMRLRLALPGWIVCERSCPAQASSIVLNLDFAPLDYVRTAGQLQANAHWLLIGRGRQGSTEVKAPVLPDNAQGQAAALGQVLNHVAGDIAAALNPIP